MHYGLNLGNLPFQAILQNTLAKSIYIHKSLHISLVLCSMGVSCTMTYCGTIKPFKQQYPNHGPTSKIQDRDPHMYVIRCQPSCTNLVYSVRIFPSISVLLPQPSAAWAIGTDLGVHLPLACNLLFDTIMCSCEEQKLV